MRRTCLLFGLLLGTCGSVIAQPDQELEQRIREWLVAEQEAASTFRQTESSVLRWYITQESHADPTATESVNTSPDQDGEPRAGVIRRTLLLTPDGWRVFDDIVEDDVTRYIDRAVTPTSAWKLTPAWLVVFDPSHPSPQGHPYREISRQAIHQCELMLYGGLHIPSLYDWQLDSVDLRDGRWFCHFLSPTRVGQLRFALRWDSSAHRAFVDSAAYNSPSGEAETWQFAGWRFVSESRRWLATRVVYSVADRTVRLTLDDDLPEFPADPAQLLTIPAFDGLDQHRGSLHVESITDYRISPMTTHVRTPDGFQTFNDLDLAELERARRLGFRRVGWCLASLSVSLVLVHSLRRR